MGIGKSEPAENAAIKRQEDWSLINTYIDRFYKKIEEDINSLASWQKLNKKTTELLVPLASQTAPLQLVGRNIGFLGLTSTGKSTMINTLLGCNVVKVGNGETTTSIASYSANNYCLYDVPGRSDSNSYMSTENIGLLKALTGRIVLITATINEMTQVFRLFDALNLNYEIVVNKFDLVNPDEQDNFKCFIKNQIQTCKLKCVNNLWFLSASNPKQFSDWQRMVDYLSGGEINRCFR